MDEIDSNKFDPMAVLNQEALPDDTITIIIKCGGKTYSRGVNLEESQETTAKLALVLMQQVVDTVDAKGLKKGGSLYDPENGGETVEDGDNS